MAAQHTPGPWELDDAHGRSHGYWIYGAGGANTVCQVDSARAGADLALILAAPGLLEACEAQYQRLSDLAEYLHTTAVRMARVHILMARELSDEAAVIRGALDDYRAAIAKAKGE